MLRTRRQLRYSCFCCTLHANFAEFADGQRVFNVYSMYDLREGEAMKSRNKFVMLTVALIALCGGYIVSGGKAESTAHIPAVSALDMNKFEGTWYELSRIPIPIAGDWVNTVDKYIHNADGSWSVRYEGNKGSPEGKRKVLKQSLRIPDASKPGEMQVSFLPLIWADYRLIYMSEDNRFMLVTSKTMDMLWLMSRESNPPAEAYDKLVARASGLGFDTGRLERVLQRY